MKSRSTTSPRQLSWHALVGAPFGYFSGKQTDATAYGILRIAALPDGSLWIRGASGTIAYKNTQKVFELPPQIFDVVFFFNTLWIYDLRKGLQVYDHAAWKPVATPFARCFALTVTADMTLVAIASDGMWETKNGVQWNHTAFDFTAGILDTCWFDPDGSLWLTSSRETHLYHYERVSKAVTVILLPHAKHGYSQLPVVAGLPDRSGGFWASIDGVGFLHWNGQTWIKQPRARDLVHDGIYGIVVDVAIDRHDRVWALTDGYLCLRTNDTWRNFLIERPLEKEGHTTIMGRVLRHTCLAIDNDELIWIGTADGEIYTVHAHAAALDRPVGYQWHALEDNAHAGFPPLILDTL